MNYINMQYKYHTNPDEGIFVIGPLEEFLEKQYIKKAFRMNWNEGDIWK